MSVTATIRSQKETDAFLTSKSLLAKLLAAENIQIVHDPKARTAAFDVKNRVLILPVWSGVTVDLYDLFVGHEVGHALYTRMDEWGVDIERVARSHYPKSWKRVMPIVQGLFNVLEDPRIEKLMKRKYPGLRASFARGYTELWERDFFKVRDKLSAIPFSPRQCAVLTLMDRINLHFKAGQPAAVYFAEDELPFVARVEALETWSELVALAEDLITFLKIKAPAAEPKPPTPPKGNPSEQPEQSESDESEQSDDGEQSDAGDDEQSESDDDTAGESDGDEAADAGDEQSESEGGTDSGDADGDDGESENEADGDDGESEATSGESQPSPATDEPTDGKENAQTAETVDEESDEDSALGELQTSTDKALETASSEMSTTDVNYFRLTAPDFNYDAIVHDYKRVMTEHAKSLDDMRSYAVRRGYEREVKKIDSATTWATKFRIAEKQNISFMSKEFDLKKAAASHAREMTAKSGRLDMSKLHSYKYSDDLFRRNLIQNKGQSHGIVFILDYSGSMQHTMPNLVSSIISMSLFCRASNIPFDVYLFTDGNSARAYNGPAMFTYPRDTDIFLTQFFLRNVLSSRMTLKEYNLALTNLRLLALNAMPNDTMSGTPLLGATLLAKSVVERFKAMHKLDVVSLILMTDGDSNMFERVKSDVLTKEMNSYGTRASSSYIVFQDPKTRREYTKKIEGMPDYSMAGILGALSLKNLKDVTHCNVIGYFMGGTQSCSDRMHGLTTAELIKARNTLNTNGWALHNQFGYDEYYFILPNTLASNQERFRSDDAADFTAFNKRKGNSRAVLKSIVHRICAQGA